MSTLSFLMIGVVLGIAATGIAALLVEGLARLCESVIRRVSGSPSRGH